MLPKKNKKIFTRYLLNLYYNYPVVHLFQWVNGKHVMDHDGGHLPFEADVTDYLKFDDGNLVTVAVNNTLSPHTLPPGTISYKKGPQYVFFRFKIEMNIFYILMLQPCVISCHDY